MTFPNDSFANENLNKILQYCCNNLEDNFDFNFDVSYLIDYISTK